MQLVSVTLEITGIMNHLQYKKLIIISRFHFQACLVDENHEPVSSIAMSSSFTLRPYTAGKVVDQYIQSQAHKARNITKHIKGNIFLVASEILPSFRQGDLATGSFHKSLLLRRKVRDNYDC